MATPLQEKEQSQIFQKPVPVVLDQLTQFSSGKKAHLYRMLYAHGPGHGKMQFLPIDHGLEHGPVDFFVNPAAEDPDFQYRLALEGHFSGIAMHYGLAQKYIMPFAGQVPLILKINGKTNIPPAANPFSSLTGTIEDAIHLGADAIGYTLYVGSPEQAEDIAQFTHVRDEAERFGLPLIMWAYPRGTAIDQKGGDATLYAIDYAARVACELGADVVKLKIPEPNPPNWEMQPQPYRDMQGSLEDNIRKVVHSAGKTFVIFSGGKEVNDQELLERTRLVMSNGASGVIFGRNIWQRPFKKALGISREITQLIQSL